MFSLSRIITIFAFLTIFGMGATAFAEDQQSTINPLRLAYINGSVSFWRYGAEDWVEARVNTPLITGDALYTGTNAELELQAEGRAFIRADDNTQISLVNQTPDFMQLKVTSGRVSLDLRTLPSAEYTVELDTPNAVFTINRAGYYRVDVDSDVHFITRRGGQATMTPANGQAMTILPSEEIVVRQGANMGQAETYAAPELDEWDHWNYDRTNSITDAVSDRYVSTGIAGASELDHYGNWRNTEEYGPVWVPDGVAENWAPYSTGRWIWDSSYQWTWVDDAPWGWAPFHYGRWVYFGGYWAWAPGPVVLHRPVYAPALVAFYGNRSGVSVSAGTFGLGWVALSWGEPLVPWWGRSGFIGRPWWGGWGGPRVVNNVIVRQTTVINVTNITYANRRISNAFVATTHEEFGRNHIRDASNRPQSQEGEMAHIRGALPIKPNSRNLVADAPRSASPPEQLISRPVVETRRAQETKLPWHNETTNFKAAEQHVVPAPKPSVTDLQRPVTGTDTGPERARPPLPPTYKNSKRQTEPVSPSAIVRDQGAVSSIESKPDAAAPSQPSISPRERQLVPPVPAQPPMPAVRQQQTPQVEQSVRQIDRTAPPVTTASPRMHDLRPQNQARSVQQEPQSQPSQHIEVTPQITPQDHHVQTQQGVEHPQGVQRNLPGEPANRTYSGLSKKKIERDHQ